MAGVVSGFVSDVAWLMKNAALRKDVPTFVMATVVTASPATVMLDGTTMSRQVTRNVAGKLRTGQRVRVEVQGTSVTIIAAPASFGPLALTMASGWGGITGYQPTVSRQGSTVFLTGLATRGSSTTGTMATLPEWAVPSRIGRLTATSGNFAVGLVGVQTDGTLRYESGWWSAAPTGYVALGHSWEAAN